MMSSILTPKGFLTYGGAILLILGILGFVALSSATAPAAR